MTTFALRYREGCRRGTENISAQLPLPSGIICHSDIIYGPDKTWNKLDIYVPEHAVQPVPVIVNVHGGGWVYGDKETNKPYCMSLCKYGFAVINFSYRLAPEVKFPAPLEDLNRIIHYLCDYGSNFGLDTEKVCLVGDSAGAHIAALYTCICTNPACSQFYHISPPAGFSIRATGLNCGIYHLPRCKNIVIRALLKATLKKDTTLRKESPVTYLTTHFPPCYLLTAKGDFLRKQTSIFERELKRHNVTCIRKVYGTRKDPLTHVFQCDIRLEQANQANREECAFLMSML